MNNRYLYRAKRRDNGEWVEGYYAYMKQYHYIMPNGSYDSWYEIYPETISQCTGFYDDDGKGIFEGDIVGFIDCTSTESGYSEHYCRGQVVWDEETGSFQVTERLSAESYEVLDRGCKDIGNIFDNPELLEVER